MSENAMGMCAVFFLLLLALSCVSIKKGGGQVDQLMKSLLVFKEKLQG